MRRKYRERLVSAQEDAEKHLAQHVIREEPVRSFRFHCPSSSLKVEKRQVGAYPFAKILPPTEGVKFGYSSNYAFTLTWTPGHMTIVGDLGELTVVHYHAMPTLEEACKWLDTPDFNYLLSKTAVKQEFDRDSTIESLWQMTTEEVDEHVRYFNEEKAAWEKSKPKWRKRERVTKADFEEQMEWWKQDDPRLSYGFRECNRPSHLTNRGLWSDAEQLGWHVPDGFWHLARLWKYLLEEGEHFERDPNALLTQEGRDTVKRALERWCDGRDDAEIGAMIYRELDYCDWYGDYDYPWRSYLQIAAIQHGARMILDQHCRRMELAA